jgi:immune inhibitor A
MEPWVKWVLIVLGVLLLVTCCCVAVVAAVAYYGYTTVEESDISGITNLIPDVEATAVMLVDPLSSTAEDTLELLKNSHVPENNLVELAERLKGKQNIPETVQDGPQEFALGDMQTFWATQMDTNENFPVNTRLEYITDHAYFWIEDGVGFDYSDLAALAETFENEIYPTTREVFGSEWTPGIDNDEHIYMVYAGGLGSTVAGYFSSRDSVHVDAFEYSNMHEMFFFNADATGLDDEYTYGVLAHEFQHMIQWWVDRNESTWLNEGMAELSAFLNGYDVGGFDWFYMMNPDMQLTNWPDDPGSASANYGAAFLFVNYIYDRFGEDLMKDLVVNSDNGLESIDEVLKQEGLDETADSLFQDWAIANYLLDESAADGRYWYSNYPDAPQAGDTETISSCAGKRLERSVKQYGVDYIGIDCAGEYQLTVTGSTEVSLLPVSAHSGDYFFWSNKGDESDMTLTRQFDLTGVSGPVSLDYWTWYDIETDYDYLYVEVSRDGEIWEIIQTPGGTGSNPSGNSYGWAYNGVSDGWVQEQVDLSAYAGENIWVRFEYITDAAVNGEGFALDDVRLTALGYESDFETDDGGWEAAGFVCVSNTIPQTYALSLLTFTDNGTIVEKLELDEMNRWQGSLEIGGGVEKAVLVVSGIARFTNQPAGYTVEFGQ